MSASLSHSRGNTAMNGAGLGVDRPAELTKSDDEYDAYRKRMMLAYRFRPNPLVTSVSYCLLFVVSTLCEFEPIYCNVVMFVYKSILIIFLCFI